MNKEEQIASIKQRILDEHRKHKNIDWAEIAARKIYSTHLVKEKCNLPVVSITEGELCEICNQNEAKVIYKTCYKCEEYIINGEHN